MDKSYHTGNKPQSTFFPATALGGELFAKVRTAAPQLGDFIAQHVSSSTSAKQGTATKSAAREALRRAGTLAPLRSLDVTHNTRHRCQVSPAEQLE
jgi:hypothetical protein